MRFNPLHCGAVVASSTGEDALKSPRVVSIPFIAGQWSLQIPPPHGGGIPAGFNPLHCGAVVASCGGARRAPPQRFCFNPLHCGAVVASRGGARGDWAPLPCFNPLHCGAVVASRRARVATPNAGPRVSIPFIAGQWSLRDGAPPSPEGGRVSIPFIAGQWSLQAPQRVDERTLVKFQSPSLRGSGRFPAPPASARTSPRRFNPLHCGAVVASGGRRSPICSSRSCFNPLHCGAVVASDRARAQERARAESFNPLHCGAVVASPSRTRTSFGESPVSIPFIAGQWSLPRRTTMEVWIPWSFNPLHCGAVVASRTSLKDKLSSGQVSIPFIAGQWSLPPRSRPKVRLVWGFQSPSLRGSGRFPRFRRHRRRRTAVFQSPSLRGSGRFGNALKSPRCCGMFQSPSLRGSGRFRSPQGGGARRKKRFNPLHCGAVVASGPTLTGSDRSWPRFNPLHCGAVVASGRADRRREDPRQVSIPFIAGQWSLRTIRTCKEFVFRLFQSPSLRGSGRFTIFVAVAAAALLVSIPFIAGQWSLPKKKAEEKK